MHSHVLGTPDTILLAHNAAFDLGSTGRQYLIAYCHAAEMEKTYRLDRIREIHAAEV